MRLFHLKRLDGLHPYEENAAFVVRASTMRKARALAATKAGNEGTGMWTDPQFSSCRPLWEKGVAEIIIADFLSG